MTTVSEVLVRHYVFGNCYRNKLFSQNNMTLEKINLTLFCIVVALMYIYIVSRLNIIPLIQRDCGLKLGKMSLRSCFKVISAS